MQSNARSFTSSLFSAAAPVASARLNFLHDHWRAILAVVLVCVGMIVMVVIVIKIQPRVPNTALKNNRARFTQRKH